MHVIEVVILVIIIIFLVAIVVSCFDADTWDNDKPSKQESKKFTQRSTFDMHKIMREADEYRRGIEEKAKQMESHSKLVLEETFRTLSEQQLNYITEILTSHLNLNIPAESNYYSDFMFEADLAMHDVYNEVKSFRSHSHLEKMKILKEKLQLLGGHLVGQFLTAKHKTKMKETNITQRIEKWQVPISASTAYVLEQWRVDTFPGSWTEVTGGFQTPMLDGNFGFMNNAGIWSSMPTATYKMITFEDFRRNFMVEHRERGYYRCDTSVTLLGEADSNDFTITHKQAQSIIDIACDKWTTILAQQWAEQIVKKQVIEIKREFYDRMRKECTDKQHLLFDGIFGKMRYETRTSQVRPGKLIRVSDMPGLIDRNVKLPVILLKMSNGHFTVIGSEKKSDIGIFFDDAILSRHNVRGELVEGDLSVITYS